MNEIDCELKPTTRVLYYLTDRKEVLLTNEENRDGEPEDALYVFAADRNGTVTMEGNQLAAVFSHNPYLLFELVDIHRTYGEVNPDYFSSRSA